MSYFLYKRTHENGLCRNVWKKDQTLFDKNGLIAQALEGRIPEGQQPPWQWCINVPDFLRQQNSIGNVFVIDLIPRGKQKEEFTFYELLKVWGCSYGEGYSSALLLLQNFLNGRKYADFNYRDFTSNDEDDATPIFTFLYFRGSIKDGKLSGSFKSPGKSNSLLLWPVDCDYFIPIIQHHTTAYKLGGEQRLLG